MEIDWLTYFKDYPGDREGLCFDLETTGLEAHDPTVRVVAIGFSDSRGSVAIDLRNENKEWWAEGQLLFFELLDCLIETKVPLTAYNLVFDAAFLGRERPLRSFNFAWDAYAAHRHLATESWIGQEHGLKASQVNLLGWDNRGDKELDDWLIAAGHTRRSKGEIVGDHSCISQVVHPIMTKYCALDCDSTWQLMHHVLLPAMDQFAVYPDYEKIFLESILCTVEQQFAGIRIDREKLTKYQQELSGIIAAARKQFLGLPLIKKGVEEFNRQKRIELIGEAPPMLSKVKVPPEPPRLTKSGSVSKNWERYQFRLKDGQFTPKETSRYKNWLEKKKSIEQTDYFNPGSPDHIRWLFYTHLDFPVLVETKNKDNPLPATDEDARRGWGAMGVALEDWAGKTKELSFVESILEFSKADGRYHPQLKMPGTDTGRLSGSGGFNIQNPVKSIPFLECFIPDEDYVLYQADFSSLEPCVKTEASGDEASIKIYGKHAVPNDLYLFNGCAFPGIGEKFRACGYDPNNPIKEAIGKCKKEHKGLRNLAKLFTLSADYGAGAGRWYETAQLAGLPFSLSECKVFRQAYNNLYKGVTQWEEYLHEMWETSGGYILNVIGRPIAVNECRLKDLKSAFCQSGGHDILLILLAELSKQLREKKIRWYPFIWDFHDEFIIQVHKDDVHIVSKLVVELEEWLDGVLKPRHIRFKLAGGVYSNLAQIKCED
jgi:DNA polymerase I-like protein with 3'-5' exonuclease and polymerase domains